MGRSQTRIVLIFLVILVVMSLFGNIFAVKTMNAMTEKQNYSLYGVYNEATYKLTEGLNILHDHITQDEPSLHEAYNAISTAHSLIDSCQYLNKDFKISILNFQEYMRILSVQNDFQPEYDLPQLEKIILIYEKIVNNGWFTPELPNGYSIGSVRDITLQKDLVDSLQEIEEISGEALKHHVSS